MGQKTLLETQNAHCTWFTSSLTFALNTGYRHLSAVFSTEHTGKEKLHGSIQPD